MKWASSRLDATEILVSLLKTLRLNYVLNYMLNYAPSGIRVWIENQKMQRKIRNRRKLVPEEELERKYREALLLLAEKQGAEALGDYLEFGVYNGTSLTCMHRAIEDLGFEHVRLFGFDSFEGMPDTAKTDDGGHWRPGQFRSDYEFTRAILTSEGVNWDRTVLVRGWFSDILNNDLIHKHKITKASVIMIDCDMYLSAKEALDFCASLIQDKAIVFSTTGIQEG